MSTMRQAREVARIDLVVEGRVGETIRVIVPFAVAALLVLPLAQGPNLALLRQVGPAVFWTLGLLFGMQIALRQSANDTDARRDLYALAGVDPAARFLGRTASGTVLLTVFLAVLFVAILALYDTPLTGAAVPALAMSVVLFAYGLAALATLAGEVSSGLRNRGALASLIVAPLSLPLVMGAAQTAAGIGRDAGILSWSLLLLATDIALTVVGVAVAGPLEEART
ncbi:MAG: heme exporter protein CcmB [Acidimicrobiales bacterium]|jgi:heme exporter protein B|nr:heme exporter protein CcmB [Acidimicrobiales bacterium]HLV90283.1 heme exporter protein CcmB [Acidimicrobiia bacterium]